MNLSFQHINPPINQRGQISQNNHPAVSFGGGNPIYAITTDRQVIKFESVAEAAQKLGTVAHNILNGLRGARKSTFGLVFRPAEEILDASGNLDLKKVKKHAEALQSVCVIDKNCNIYAPINNEDLKNMFGLSYKNLDLARNPYKLLPNNKIAVKRTDVEDKFGKLDIGKIHSFYHKLLKKEASGFYAVSPDYKVEYIKDTNAFAQRIGKSYPGIRACIGGRIKTVGGYALIRQSEVENEVGKLDFKKLIEEAKKRFTSNQTTATARAIIGMKADGKTKLFKSITDAQTSTGVNKTTIFHLVSGKTQTPHTSWRFVYADRVALPSGKIDQEKLQELRGKLFAPNKVVAININGETKVCDNIEEAAKATGKSVFTVTDIMKGKRPSTKSGWVYAYANPLRDETGRIPKSKIQEIYNRAFKQAGYTSTAKTMTSRKVVGISEFGEVRVFNSLDEAARKTDKCEATIMRVLKGKRPATKAGWHYATAEELSDETGKISTEKIKERFQQIFKRDPSWITLFKK